MATERRDRKSFAPLDFEKENGIDEVVPMVKRKRTRSLGRWRRSIKYQDARAKGEFDIH